ncbi:serine hydrolase [Sphingomonas sp. IC-56]|uniref:serine hydrolase n=1 Tax=Sphingomonas sp. IC-56 TaxID=2898529 RepID=UPI001E502EBC|nr:serine hydrolase [Sphingomonas sp. IC-56]MCD2322642.1 serine hydrolase [Sphingomonas sp. IC-56]
MHFVLIAMLTLVPAAPLQAKAAAQDLTAAQTREIEDIAKHEMHRRGIPGMQLAVVRGSRIALSRAWGIADKESGTPATPATVFTLNSATKAFTGVAIMQLVEAGELSLDDPISRHVSALPDSWRAITLRQLLTHVSGLPDILVLPANGQGTGTLLGGGGEDSAWNAVRQLPLEAPVGTRYRYNQTNYVLLGKAIEHVTGKPFQMVMAEREFAPAGAKSLVFGDARDVVPNRTRTYRYSGGVLGVTARNRPLEHAIDEFSPFLRTAGGLNGSAEDVARWIIALQSGRLMNRTTLGEMWTPGRFADGKPTSWGMGWPLRVRPSHTVATAIGGRRSAVFVYPQDDLAIVVLTNLAGGRPEDFIEELAGAIYPELKLANGGGLSTAALALHRALSASGFERPDAALAAVRREQPAFSVPESELNEWGGRLLDADRQREGRAVLTLATRLYPASANAWDSLGEAEEASGHVDQAILAYRRSVSIDPKNTHAIERIDSLSTNANDSKHPQSF